MLIKNTKVCRKVDKGSTNWLSLRTFSRIDELIEALRDDGREIWAADLAKDSEEITASGPPLPSRLAIVIGRETDGVSAAMLQNCDKKIYLPMSGFTESFNLSVATALILQRVFDICPSARGEMDEAERRQLRLQWFEHLVRSNPTKYKTDPRPAPPFHSSSHSIPPPFWGPANQPYNQYPPSAP
jgi:tRNA(Leu) C34 or U34 (ribose-2'-O)-methylase TrmL